MWNHNQRNQIWNALDKPWDIIIIGGGITGAGILHEATNAGYRSLLLEAHDFSSGTSSRSSKMVHGGFRYLAHGQIKLVRQSVSERERLMKEARGLVNPLGFLLANFKGDSIPTWMFASGLIFYDLLALKWGHRHYDTYDMHDLCPPLRQDGLIGGFRYFDAQTDDSRLVLRVIDEAIQKGGTALNYAKVIQFLTIRSKNVCGVVVKDESPDSGERTVEIEAPVVINATGAWADELRAKIAGKPRLRKLRGSHLVFPQQYIPINRAVSFAHPFDQRFVFAFPWEGTTLVGTTDVDLEKPLESDIKISQTEAEYLLEAAQYAFPQQNLGFEDAISTFSGVRPVVNTGKTDPSKESREHILWRENGLLTVTGGKLTTFRLMAHDALRRVRSLLPERPIFDHSKRVFLETKSEFPSNTKLTPNLQARLIGRYGANTLELVKMAKENELEPITSSPTVWAELRWAARSEGVVHLDDLLLRRVRLGLLLPSGGLNEIEKIREIVKDELNWDEEKWIEEEERYRKIWNTCYYL
jgi:glycerol-3-phosphate dehydrogenase